MKRIVCQLMIVWLALVSGDASMHAMNDAAHDASHSAYLAAQISPIYSSAQDADMTAQVDHSDTCIHVNCCLTSALLAPMGTYIPVDLQVGVPAFHQRWLSNTITSNIERPKWAYTTPDVVSLLS